MLELCGGWRTSIGPSGFIFLVSTARGDATPDSDYDLMVVLPNDAPADRKDPGLGYTAVEGLARSGDFLVWTRRNFDSRLHLKGSLPATVLREGMLLYADGGWASLPS